MSGLPMGHNIPYTRVWIFLLVTVVISGILVVLGWQRDHTIVHENHLVENTQALLLAIGLFLHGHRLKTLPNQRILDVYIRIFLMFLLLSFWMREIDIRDILTDFTGGPYHFWRTFELSLRIFVGAFFLAYVLFLFSKLPFFWRVKWQVFKSPIFHLTFMGGLLYTSGWPFDKKLFLESGTLTFYQHQLIEETLELWATMFLFAAAWWPHNVPDTGAEKN